MSSLKSHELRHKLSPHTMTSSEIYDGLNKLSMSIFDSHPQQPQSDDFDTNSHTAKNTIFCDLCGAESYLKVKISYPDSDDVVARYNQLAQEFVKLGYDAKMHYYCRECVKKDRLHLSPIVFTFQAEGMKQPIASYPNCEKYEDQYYRMALDFLTGADCAGTLKDIYTVHDSSCYAIVGRIIGNKYYYDKNYHDEPRHDNRKKRDFQSRWSLFDDSDDDE